MSSPYFSSLFHHHKTIGNHVRKCKKTQNFKLFKTFNYNKLFKLNKLSYLQGNYCIFITLIIDFTNIHIYKYLQFFPFLENAINITDFCFF